MSPNQSIIKEHSVLKASRYLSKTFFLSILSVIIIGQNPGQSSAFNEGEDDRSLRSSLSGSAEGEAILDLEAVCEFTGLNSSSRLMRPQSLSYKRKARTFVLVTEMGNREWKPKKGDCKFTFTDCSWANAPILTVALSPEFDFTQVYKAHRFSYDK